MTDEPMLLKDLIDRKSVGVIAEAVATARPGLVAEAIVRDVFDDAWEQRELKQRIRHVAVTLHAHLDSDYPSALAVLRRAADGLEETGFAAMAFNDFVEEYGLDHLEDSLAALEQFTILVSAEFAVRPFIVRYPELLMERLRIWSAHDDWRVRRLASEGCRPRLPWGISLPALRADPAPILPILEVLRHDPSEDVRRSVANNLNDIAKDHPDLVVSVLETWQDGSSEITAITKHALRTLLKQGHRGALALLGFRHDPQVEVRATRVEPTSVSIGDSAELSFRVVSTDDRPQTLMVDYAVVFQNASRTGSRKVFKGKVVELAPGGDLAVRRKISLMPMSTRRIFAGAHRAEVQINGVVMAEVDFQVTG